MCLDRGVSSRGSPTGSRSAARSKPRVLVVRHWSFEVKIRPSFRQLRPRYLTLGGICRWSDRAGKARGSYDAHAERLRPVMALLTTYVDLAGCNYLPIGEDCELVAGVAEADEHDREPRLGRQRAIEDEV